MDKIKKLFSKKFGIVYTLVGLGVALPKIVFAAWDDAMYLLAEALFRFFLWPAIGLLRLELWVLPKIASYNNFTREAGVVSGWTIVRDITNSFFIVILLIIAFATILRISSYGYKQLLARLLIVAILVNFSMTIVGLAIDVSQIIMLTFLNAIKTIMAGNIMVGLGLQSVFSMSENYPSGEVPSLGDFIASLIMAGIMLIITVVILAAFIGMLAMRIVQLWISIVLAPAAFVAFIFPNAKKYYNQWSMDLGKNLMTGPALLFFLWLAFTILKDNNIAESMDVTSADQMQEFSQALTTGNVVKYIMGTALLLGGLQFAAKSGAAGSSLMGKASAKMNSTASGIGRRYAGGLASRTGAFASKAVIDSKGNARGLGLVASKAVPFWGGRLQRSAIKMQGYNQARIAKERADDQKYVTPEMQEAFQGSQAKPYFADADSKLFRGVGQAMSFATSIGGGIYDSQVKQAQNRVDNDDVTIDNVEETVRSLGNDTTRRDKAQAKLANTINKEDAQRYVSEKGNSTLNNYEAKSVVDKNGEVTKGAKNVTEAMIHSKDTTGPAIAKAMKDVSKDTKKAAATAFVEQAKGKELGNDFLKTTTGEHGTQVLSLDNNGKFKFDNQNPVIKATEAALALDPTNLEARKLMEGWEQQTGSAIKGKMLPKDFYLNLPKRDGESPEQLANRKKRAEKLSEKYDKEYEESPKTKDDLDELNKKRWQLYGAPGTENIETERKQLDKMHDDGKIKDDEYEDRMYSINHASGAKQVIDSENDQELKKAVEARIGTQPQYDPNLPVDEYNPDDVEEIEKRAEKKVTNEQIEGLIESSKDPDGNPTMTRLQAINKIAESQEVRGEAKNELADERKKEYENYEKESDRIAQEIKAGFTGLDKNGQIEPDAITKIESALKDLSDDDPRKETLKNQKEYVLASAEIQQIENQLSGLAKDNPNRKKLEERKDELKGTVREIDSKRNASIGRQEDKGINVAINSIYSDLSGGMDYSDLTKLNASKPQDKRIIQNFAIHANDSQQRQFYNDANPEQLRIFAEAMAEQGMNISRQIMTSFDEGTRKIIEDIRDKARGTQRNISQVGGRVDDAPLED